MPICADDLLTRPCFTESDYAIVREALAGLPYEQSLLIKLHFWLGISVSELATLMNHSEATIYHDLEHSLSKLRLHCEAHPQFSRGISAEWNVLNDAM